MSEWSDVARRAGQDADGLGADLLGDFLPRLAEASRRGTRIPAGQLAGYRALGAAAAERGVALRGLIDLYLSAAWRAWRQLPAVGGDDAAAVRDAGDVVLHAVDDVVAVVAEGYQAARRAAVRQAGATRREFSDDLLGGTGSPAGLLARAEEFGLDLTGPHAVLLVPGAEPVRDTHPRLSAAATAVGGAALVTTRHGRLVVVLSAAGQRDVDAAATALSAVPGCERVASGRPYSGPGGVARSFQEADDAAELAANFGLPDRLISAADLLVYRVLLRDRDAAAELVETVLGPLRAARGGASALLDTLDAYLSTGGNTSATARRMHLSVRAVSYRLSRVRELTGRDPDAARDRFTVYAATIAARAQGWPDGRAGAPTAPGRPDRPR